MYRKILCILIIWQALLKSIRLTRPKDAVVSYTLHKKVLALVCRISALREKVANVAAIGGEAFMNIGLG